MSGPVHLNTPLLEPAPVGGCDVCAALARQREENRRTGDMSAVSDANIEIRRHSGPEHRRRT
ncbi:hypothetical protein HRW07_07885 [Streptomyces lunaelactis]|nr:hypothetical protein [Streptomyces lunaelactis]NUL03161.1 hypothetical protein [Streptomyces lunaelactis]